MEGARKNWFYLTLNGSYLSPKALEDLSFEFPLVDIEITENNQSVQIGYLFNTPIEDFEIFHSNASRVLLVQVWESLSDSLRSEVKLSEGTNINRVFTLPKNESKGSPFMIHSFTLEINTGQKNISYGIIIGILHKIA